MNLRSEKSARSDTEARNVRPKVRDSLALLGGYHSPQLDVEVRLNTNESPFAPPREWQELVALEAATIDFHRYPDRAYSALASAIADHHGVAKENIFVANGSNEVLQTLCLTYGGPERTCVTFEPTYMLHSHIARLSGANVLSANQNANFEIEPSDLAAMIALEPAIMFLCSPNNPTGVEIDAKVVELALTATRSGTILCIDEAYGQFAQRSYIDDVSESCNLVVVRTFSKTWAMAGARVGYLVGPSWLVEELNKVVLPYHLDSFKQSAARLALGFATQMNERVETLVGMREDLMSQLRELDLTLWPSGANFILFRPNSVDSKVVWQKLVDERILIRDCSSWPGLSQCLRVTIGTNEENLRFLDALRGILSSVER